MGRVGIVGLKTKIKPSVKIFHSRSSTTDNCNLEDLRAMKSCIAVCFKLISAETSSL